MGTQIILGGQEIDIVEFPLRKNKQWRERAKIPLSAQRSIAESTRQAQTTEDIVPLYNQYVDLVDDQIDLIADLVFEYLPDQSKRDEMADKATQTEILDAFLVLSRLSFSTGFFWALTGASLTSGSVGQQTGTNSPSPSGEDGLTN